MNHLHVPLDQRAELQRQLAAVVDEAEVDALAVLPHDEAGPRVVDRPALHQLLQAVVVKPRHDLRVGERRADRLRNSDLGW